MGVHEGFVRFDASAIHMYNMGILDGLLRGEDGCIGPHKKQFVELQKWAEKESDLDESL